MNKKTCKCIILSLLHVSEFLHVHFLHFFHPYVVSSQVPQAVCYPSRTLLAAPLNENVTVTVKRQRLQLAEHCVGKGVLRMGDIDG